MNDNVNHPTHYNVGGIEVIDFINDRKFNFNIGNAVKYITRAGKKGDAVEDLKKAIFYLQYEINHLTPRHYDYDAFKYDVVDYIEGHELSHYLGLAILNIDNALFDVEHGIDHTDVNLRRAIGNVKIEIQKLGGDCE